jgi:hypothetical protein
MFDLFAFPPNLVRSCIACHLHGDDLLRLGCTSKVVGGKLLNAMSMERACMDVMQLFLEHQFKPKLLPQGFMTMAVERCFWGRLGPLKKWLTTNRVRLDEHGFYSPFTYKKVTAETPRVSIKLWETGMRSRDVSIKSPAGLRVVVRKPVLLPGFELR